MRGTWYSAQVVVSEQTGRDVLLPLFVKQIEERLPEAPDKTPLEATSVETLLHLELEACPLGPQVPCADCNSSICPRAS